MRLSVFVGVSVDGFLARKDDRLDFLFQKPDVDNGYDDFIATVDSLVIGRGTFEVVRGFKVWPYGKRPVIVLSHTPRRVRVPSGTNCEVMSATPKQVVAHLAKRGVKHIYVDGGKTIQGFLRAGLVQRMIITRVPVLIGEGIPLFGLVPRDVRLKHVKTRTFRNGMVQTEYRVVRR
ncbi:MAG: dihydrofolate reductase family protein [Thermoplasmata archaeon]|jgi:dihydrofolate reductase